MEGGFPTPSTYLQGLLLSTMHEIVASMFTGFPVFPHSKFLEDVVPRILKFQTHF